MSELPYLLLSGQGFEAPCAPGREIDTFRFNDSFADPPRNQPKFTLIDQRGRNSTYST